MPPKSSFSEWGRRAADLYTADYAARYRAVDDRIRRGELVRRFGNWLGIICDSFGREIGALDLGCGTGRYFWALRHVRELVGIDVSAEMLEQAKAPVDEARIGVGKVTLVHGDFLTVPVERGRFDLVYSIGVLGEHVPFDTTVARRVHEWLAPLGRFAFTGVHRDSFSVPRTWQRRVAEAVMPMTPPGIRERVRRRLLAGGLYVDESYLEEVLNATGFVVESLHRHRSDVHVHCLCVARKVTA